MKTMMAIAVGVALVTVGMIEGAARADTPTATCEAREASVYFAPGTAELNDLSKQIIGRVAADAKVCGRAQIAADAPDGALKAQRMAAIAGTFAASGVRIATPNAAPAPMKTAFTAGETMKDRTAVIRLVPAR